MPTRFPRLPRRSSHKKAGTYFSAILRYANVGVKRSAEIEAVTGRRFGAN